MKLIAMKSMRYKTRRLQAGDAFEPTDKYGRIFLAARLARPAPDDQPVARAASVRPAPPAAEEHSTIDDLREEAEALGIDVDGRWGVTRLQNEIARAKL